MKNGVNIPLQIIETSTDGATYGKDYIDIVSGNFNEIDHFAGEMIASFDTISSSPSLIHIYGIRETSEFYSATVPELESLIVNEVYMISFNETNPAGGVSLRINNPISVALNKVSPTDGVLVPLEPSDMLANTDYLYRYNGTVFVLMVSDALTFDGKKINEVVLKSEVIDNLEDDSTNLPLSGNMGKDLETRKANKDFSNVNNDIFKSKALDSGVLTQLFLKDSVTGTTYNVQIANATIVLMEVNVDGDSAFHLIDVLNGKNYKLIVENSILKIEEV